MSHRDSLALTTTDPPPEKAPCKKQPARCVLAICVLAVHHKVHLSKVLAALLHTKQHRKTGTNKIPHTSKTKNVVSELAFTWCFVMIMICIHNAGDGIAGGIVQDKVQGIMVITLTTAS